MGRNGGAGRNGRAGPTPQEQGQTPFSRHLSNSRTGDPADSWPGGRKGGALGRPDPFPPAPGTAGGGWGRRGGAPATHRQAEMLPIVAVQFMMPLFQSRVNHQLVTSPMVVPPLARRAGLRRGLLVVVVGGVTVLHAVNPT